MAKSQSATQPAGETEAADGDRSAGPSGGRVPGEVQPESSGHLTANEFYSVLRSIDSLGFTWTCDLPPNIKAKDKSVESTLDFNELRRIQNSYPDFPNELGYVIWYVLTGTKPVGGLVGSDEELEKKAGMVRGMVITPEFSSEFFFKHMLKVPYISTIDWEVVLKKFERGVLNAPNNAYALISVLLESTVHDVEKSTSFTFAANEQRIESLIDQLTEILFALRRTRQEITAVH